MAYPLDMATDDFSPPPRTGLEPNGNVVVDSYRQDIMNGFEQAAPAFNSVWRTMSSLYFGLAIRARD